MNRIVLLDVESDPTGGWNPDSEVEIGDFENREEAISFSRESLLSEGWDEEEIDQMPTPGTPGSRYQFREKAD